jgi:hemerythrin-like domain-containing protein
MLRITGELADGWVPSMGYADPGRLAELNERVDEAAEAAGRSPQAIRRIYNVFGRFGSDSGFLQGTPMDWSEQLAGLTLEQGISTYILGTDDADTLRRFADEVVPAVRELVAAERSRPADDEQPAPITAHAWSEAAPLSVQATSDTGERRTGELPWDEPSRPTHAEPVNAAYTSDQQAVPQHLVDIHDALRAELQQVRAIVAQVRNGHLTVGAARSAINTMTMRQNNWTLGAYCESYCRIVTGHHTLEDRSIFPHLRRSETALGQVLDRLEMEHKVIAGVLDDVDRALIALVTGDNAGVAGRESLEELQHQVDLLTDTMLSHLAYEERELIGPLARHGFT